MLQAFTASLETPRTGRFYLAGGVCGALGLGTLFASWLAPNHYVPWTSFHGEAAAFAALLLLCAARLLAGSPRRAAGPIPWWIAALLLVLAAQWASGQIAHGGDALLTGMYLVGAAWAWWLGTQSAGPVPDTRKDPLVLLSAVVVGAAACSVFVGLLQWLRMEQSLGVLAAERTPDLRVFANLGQPNHFATLCITAAVLAIFLYWRGVLKAWHLAGCLIWLMVGVTLAESRAGWLAVAVVGAFILVLGRRLGERRLYWPVLLVWAAAALFAALLGPVSEALYLAGPRGIPLTGESPRLLIWRQALHAIGEAPWFGYGMRQTLYALKATVAVVPGWLTTEYAHNLPLDLMLWFGVPLGLALVAIAAAWMWGFVRRVGNGRQVLVLAAVVPFLLHSLLEFPFAYAYFLFPVCWILGYLWSDLAGTGPMPRQRLLVRPVLLLSFCAYAGLAGALFVEYVQIEEDYRVLRFELRRVGQRPAGYEKPEIRLLTQLDALLTVGRMAPRPGMSAAELETMRTTSERTGWATLDVRYALALALNGQREEAVRRLALVPGTYGQEAGEQALQMVRDWAGHFPELESLAGR